MNYSKNQRTGRLAEAELELLFTEWGWGVGQDKIDAGYDLFVEPSREKFRGARFLVQVKGTSVHDPGRVSANVSKNRLRDYAINPMPVVIARVLPTKEVLWVYAQEWCRNNPSKLEGSGYSRISFQASKSLRNRDAFEARLSGMFETQGSTDDVVSALRRRSEYLNSLDERLSVSLTATASGETFAIQHVPGAGKLEGHLKFLPLPDQYSSVAEELAELRNYGTPISIPVQSAALTGSPLFEAIGASKISPGSLSIRQNPIASVSVQICSGSKRSVATPKVAYEADILVGSKGFSVIPKSNSNLFGFTFKAQWPEGGKGQSAATFNMRLDFAALAANPISKFVELDGLAEWAGVALETGEMLVVIDGATGLITSPIKVSQHEGLRELLAWVELLSTIHRLAKYFSSGLTIPQNTAISERDAWHVRTMYSALRGERVAVKLDRVAFELTGRPPEKDWQVRIATDLVVRLGGQELGSMPIAIELDHYDIEVDEAGGGGALVRTPASTAFLFAYDEPCADPSGTSQ